MRAILSARHGSTRLGEAQRQPAGSSNQSAEHSTSPLRHRTSTDTGPHRVDREEPTSVRRWPGNRRDRGADRIVGREVAMEGPPTGRRRRRG